LLSKEDIESIIYSGEGYNAEFKVRTPSKVKDLTEEICAFANASGGVLLIGVDDNNNIHGADIDNGKRSSIQNSINEINPHLTTEIYSVEIDNKTIWVIEVNSGNQKPYALSGAIYVRQGPNTQKLTSVEQMRDFFQQSNRIYFDETPCIDFNKGVDIDEEWFADFKIDAKLSQSVSNEQIINNLRLNGENGALKNGGVLFFGKQPDQFIDSAVIRCIAFEGVTKTQIIDDKTFNGPLMKQYLQSIQWIRSKLNIRYEIEGVGPRNEIVEIPETVFKETIINALSHRDYYDKGAKITIEVFSDRVEISNPGGLTSAISPSEFGTKSHSRNPLIFGLFVRLNMVEQVGSGIGRIKNLLSEAHLPAPIFKTEGIFSVVFQRINSLKSSEKSSEKGSEKSSGKSSGKAGLTTWLKRKELILAKSTLKLSKSGIQILELVHFSPEITIFEMSKKINISERAIEKNLQKLREKNLLERRDGDRGGFWKILVD
jgi:ATP-dependent DNA helicase RecG